jgi:excinuclease ABC subunit C
MPPFDSKRFLASAPGNPGVYRMLSADGVILYVGKAKNLKKRLSSYFRGESQLTPKTRALVAQIAGIEITVTHTETEALILENNLIKTHQPRYNILLRDDKGYPYIFLSDEEFPRLSSHRGAKRGKGRYFGPYPSLGSVRDSLNLLQKLFPVRQCENSFFRNRSRPCLQYQIKRCSAPCVGLIERAAYLEDAQHTALFLEGKSSAVVDTLAAKMQAAAAALEFEKAARYRDQIALLRKLQERQYVDASTSSASDLDVVAGVVRDGVGCVQVFTIRDGRQLGNRAYFPKHTQEQDMGDILPAFLAQYYLNPSRPLPDEIVLNHEIEDQATLQAAIAQERGRQIKIHGKVRGARARWVEMAEQNAVVALQQHKPTQYRERFAQLALALGLEELPARVECFDISHTQGERAVASCVVFDQDGPRNGDYRRFNIDGITPGDDYAAMHQVLSRRYRPPLPQGEGLNLPDLVLIDGGKGQVAQAREVLQELGAHEVKIVGVAKGPERKPGLETLILAESNAEIHLPEDAPALHLIQEIRDEAHRFAITGHRKRRAQARRASVLEDIAGIGGKRRQLLLTHFGGLQGVMRAGVEDLSKVPGINRQLAQKIYDAFHETPGNG